MGYYINHNNYRSPNDTVSDIIRASGYNRNSTIEQSKPVVKVIKYNPGVLGVSDVANIAIGAGTSLGAGIIAGHPVLGAVGMVPAALLGNYLYESAHKRARERLEQQQNK